MKVGNANSPDFLIVGAARSGTTSLYYYLKQHPQIYMSPVKEPLFFSYWDNKPGFEYSFLVHDKQTYLSLFKNAKDNQVIGEASTSYLYLTETTIQNIKRYYGEKARKVKIIAILRNPVDRAWSQHTMAIRDGLAHADSIKYFDRDYAKTLLDAGDNIGFDYIGFGMYSQQIKRYLEEFDDVKIVLYEDIANEPDATVADVFDFLNVPIMKVDTNSKYNVSGVPRAGVYEIVAKQVFQTTSLKSQFNKLLPSRLKYAVRMRLGEKLLSKVPAEEALRRRISASYSQDIDTLGQLIGRDLTNWQGHEIGTTQSFDDPKHKVALHQRVLKYREIPLIRKLFVSAGWSVGGMGLARLILILANIPIARVLGIENYGLFIILQSTLLMAGVLAGLGLGVTATKYVAELKITNPERLGAILGTVRKVAVTGGGVIGSILFLASGYIATHIFDLPYLDKYIAIAAITIVFTTIDGYQNAALLGFDSVKQSVLGSLLATLFSIPIILILAILYGLEGAVWGVVLSSIVQCLISYYLLKKVMRRYDINIGQKVPLNWDVLRNFALPALLSGAMVAPAHWICHVLLINTEGGQLQMATIGIANQWFQVVYFIPVALGRVLLPAMSEAVGKNDLELTKNILKGALIANTLIALPLALLISAFGHWILALYGIEQAGAWLALILSVTAASISAICAPVGHVIVARARIWYGWKINLVWAFVYIVSALYMLDFGAVGIAGGLLAAYLVHTILVTLWVTRELKVFKSQ